MCFELRVGDVCMLQQLMWMQLHLVVWLFSGEDGSAWCRAELWVENMMVKGLELGYCPQCNDFNVKFYF